MMESPEASSEEDLEESAEASSGPVLLSEEQKPFLEHLEELRRRLLRMILWLGIAAAVSFRFSGALLSWLIQPVGHVVFLSPVEPFIAHLKVAILGGIFLSLPLLTFEVWGFLSPALFPRERRTVFLFIPVSVGLFVSGAWFCWRFLLPAALKFFMSFSSEMLTPMLTVSSYTSFAGWLLVAAGLLFQLPLVILLLTWLGWVSPWTLLKQWRVAFIVILILAAVLTPTPDVATQFLLAAPITLLYFLSVGLAFFFTRKVRQGV